MMQKEDMTGFISREFIQSHRSWLFVYGDNLAHRGYGGQAKECRGEPNTLGIPTKYLPYMTKGSFFTDDDYPKVKVQIDYAIASIGIRHYKKIVVLPHIGEGRAQLPTRSPKIWDYLQKCLEEIKEKNEPK